MVVEIDVQYTWLNKFKCLQTPCNKKPLPIYQFMIINRTILFKKKKRYQNISVVVTWYDFPLNRVNTVFVWET